MCYGCRLPWWRQYPAWSRICKTVGRFSTVALTVACERDELLRWAVQAAIDKYILAWKRWWDSYRLFKVACLSVFQRSVSTCSECAEKYCKFFCNVPNGIVISVFGGMMTCFTTRKTVPDRSDNCSVFPVISTAVIDLTTRAICQHDCDWTRMDRDIHSFSGEHTLYETVDIRRSDEDRYCKSVDNAKRRRICQSRKHPGNRILPHTVICSPDSDL